MLKRDNFVFGLLIGTVLPLLLFIFLEEVVTVDVLGQSQPRFDKATNLVLALVANLLPFRQYMQKGHYEKTGKGILLMTFVYALVYVAIKFNYIEFQ
jgi:hypothetical protein